jgi:hypothetical protein
MVGLHLVAPLWGFRHNFPFDFGLFAFGSFVMPDTTRYLLNEQEAEDYGAIRSKLCRLGGTIIGFKHAHYNNLTHENCL